mgnify:CR=1 FL=1
MFETEKHPRWRMFVVSHTHWDREWYLPFQKFRMRLVRLVDKLLDILKRDPDFKVFMLDGQTIVLEDYLEAEPERREELEKYIREGRILVGPWYILPDEFLEGPEALIRNLMLGIKKASSFGAVMNIGYLPDMFGHIGQMPQILRGFGIDCAVVWRGVPLEVKDNEFYWEAPDGSRVLTAYLRYGYCSGANLPTGFEEFRRRIRRAVDMLSPYAKTENLLLMNGCDHLEPQPELPKLIKRFNEESEDVELIHGSLPAYFEALKRSNPVLSSYRGELRSYGRAYLLPNVLSTRIWIKQRNHRCEQALEKLVEPLIAWAWLLDPDSPESLDRLRRDSSLCWLAWKYLIQNHPHDSICGCSIDAVHEDMKYRFKAVEEISEELIRENAEAIARSVDTKELPATRLDDSHAVVVFNPDYGPRTDYVQVRLESSTRPRSIRVVDRSGRAYPAQLLGFKEEELGGVELRKDERLRYALQMLERGRIMGWVLRKGEVNVEGGTVYVKLVVADRGSPNVEEARRVAEECRRLVEKPEVEKAVVKVVKNLVDVLFIAEDVPAYGYKTFVVEPSEEEQPSPSSRGLFIENEFFRVEADPKLGTVDIYDKENRVVFKGCNRFVDDGDAGDEYNYSPPSVDTVVSEPAQPPKIAVLENGPVRSVMRIDMDYMLPIGLTGDRSSRRKELKKFPITTYVTLYRGVKRVEFRTTVDNTVEDHRLRVVFPTGIETDKVYAEGHFEVVERPVGPPTEGVETDEEPLGTYPHRSFVDVNDGRHGLMLTDRGLPEYEAIPSGDGVKLALTLLRAVGWLSQMNFKTRKSPAGPLIRTPGAQCRGRHSFEYAVIPHKGGWTQAYKEAHFYVNRLWALETGFHGGELPPEGSFIEVEPPSLVVSTVKPAENKRGVIVRFYNITDREAEGRVKLYKPFSKAYLTSLNEQPIKEVKPDPDGYLRLKVRGGKIVTIRFDP